jgi:CheY-like chemotaxis protein
LVVEDHADTAMVMRWLFEGLGHETKTASRGREALTLAKKFDPDIVILDINLPDITGYEVAQALRAKDPDHTRYIVAATGWNRDGDREHSKRAGCDEHHVKPISMMTVKTILERALEHGAR